MRHGRRPGSPALSGENAATRSDTCEDYGSGPFFAAAGMAVISWIILM